MWVITFVVLFTFDYYSTDTSSFEYIKQVIISEGSLLEPALDRLPVQSLQLVIRVLVGDLGEYVQALRELADLERQEPVALQLHLAELLVENAVQLLLDRLEDRLHGFLSRSRQIRRLHVRLQRPQVVHCRQVSLVDFA